MLASDAQEGVDVFRLGFLAMRGVVRCGQLIADGKIDLSDKAPIVAVGKSVEFAFRLKIVSATVADGTVEVKGSGADDKLANNKAALKVTVLPGTGGGGLPITGAKAGLYGGVGLGVLLLGGGLLFLARRRRVVLVAPGDERN